MKSKKTIFSFLLFSLISLIFVACSNDDVVNDSPTAEGHSEPEVILTDDEKAELKEDFAKVLSLVVYENQLVRGFLKNEAVKCFDKNYDILYLNVKDSLIGNKTFHDILAEKSSDLFISKIEKQMPLLNILFPELPMFNLKPENYSVEDKELPVAVSGKISNKLFFKGEKTDDLDKNEVPDFYVLVVNENKRVIVDKETRTSCGSCYKFKYPEYDGVNKSKATRGVVDYEKKVREAFNYFNKDDSSINSMAFQRDYVYFGITPEKRTGSLNYSVSEYLYYIEVNPDAFFRISDDPAPNDEEEKRPKNYDPRIKNYSIEKHYSDFSQADLLSSIWTDGSYNFIFEIVSSNIDTAIKVPVPASPSDLWDFHLERTYRHSTMFRSSKYSYRIHPEKFTAKRFRLSTPVNLPKWHINQEAILRRINIFEEDGKTNLKTEENYTFTCINQDKFSGNTKLDIGLGNDNKDKAEYSTSYENSKSLTTSVNKKITYERFGESDDLGHVMVYFYDPIILENIWVGNKAGRFHSVFKEYNTGIVKFSLIAF